MKLLFTLLFLLATSSVYAQNIIIVRHAEKEKGPDPVLTEQGTKRAQNLVTLLKDYDIKYVFSTNYKRTQLTAKPLATALGVAIKSYDPSNQALLIDEIKKTDEDIFVVGHSNTVPNLVYLLTGKKIVIDEDTFDALLIINQQGLVWKSSNF